jgi:hypothetical protein
LLAKIILTFFVEYYGAGDEVEGDYSSYDQEAEVLIDEGEHDGSALLIDRPDYNRKMRTFVKIDLETNRPYCSICKQTGANFETIVNHVEARHIQRREYRCLYCDKDFKTKNHRAVHIHRAHREEHKLARVFGPGLDSN